MLGVVGAGGEKPPATRLGVLSHTIGEEMGKLAQRYETRHRYFRNLLGIRLLLEFYVPLNIASLYAAHFYWFSSNSR